MFLSDYELLRQNKDGIQIIVESQIQNSTLVTSYYVDTSVRDKTMQLDVKVLPKQMASVIPIDIDLAGMSSARNFSAAVIQE